MSEKISLDSSDLICLFFFLKRKMINTLQMLQRLFTKNVNASVIDR